MCLFRNLSLALLVAGLSLQAPALRADDDRPSGVKSGVPSNDELARQVREGKILPLSVLKALVLRRIPGELINVSVDREDERLVYEFRVLRSGGQVTEVEVDAAAGKIVEIENE
ncbi:PepSY domain-containing protein (plasmid) [Ensifer sp. PDNC004]|nr:PepSY domain-containing protein [Ensifer sp. ENS09]QRY70473.1 PepSY domain-containing protein [Ensifer sp. PDNC004]